MGVKKVQLFLDNPHRVYFAGGHITGRLSFVSPAEGITCTGDVQVILFGYSHTHLIETETEYRYNYSEGRSELVQITKHYYGGRTLVDRAVSLMSSDKGRVDAGEYCLPFNIPIPEQGILSSFKGSDGFVRYYIRCKLSDQGWFSRTFRSEKYCWDIVVLPLYPCSVQKPVSISKSKTFGVFKQSAPLTVEAWISKQGYVPGERIIINARISNESDTTIKHCEITLRQRSTYSASGIIRKSELNREYGKIKRPGLKPGSIAEWNDVPFFIPALPPSHLGECSYLTDIEVYYALLLKFVAVRGLDFVVELDIYIGNVPECDETSNQVHHGPLIPSAPFEDDSRNRYNSNTNFSTNHCRQYPTKPQNSHIIAVDFRPAPQTGFKLFSGPGCEPKYTVFHLRKDEEEAGKDFEFLQ